MGEQVEDHRRVDRVADERREVGEAQPGQEEGKDRDGRRGGQGQALRPSQPARDAEDQRGFEAVHRGGQDGDRHLGPEAHPHEGPAEDVERGRVGEGVPVAVLELQPQAVPVLVLGEAAQERGEPAAAELPGELRVDADVRVVEAGMEENRQPEADGDEHEQDEPTRDSRRGEAQPLTDTPDPGEAGRQRGHADVGRRSLAQYPLPRDDVVVQAPACRGQDEQRVPERPRRGKAGQPRRRQRREHHDQDERAGRDEQAEARITTAALDLHPVEGERPRAAVLRICLEPQDEGFASFQRRQRKLEDSIRNLRIGLDVELRRGAAFDRQADVGRLDEMAPDAHSQDVARAGGPDRQAELCDGPRPVEAGASVRLPVLAEALDVVGVVRSQVEQGRTAAARGRRGRPPRREGQEADRRGARPDVHGAYFTITAA
ncbi:MAG: hypothetical protein DMF80_17620 [Acidobacteria bacterium]|nr:MAG: hypothetical protein DMF80_17620 [Acidobacteriota bacterium]